MDVVLPVLATLALNTPIYLVWLGGIVIATTRRSRHPHMSLFLTVGLTILLLMSMLSTLLSVSAPLMLIRNGWSASQLGLALGIVGGFTQLINAAAWVFVLIAAFGWRDNAVSGRLV